MAVVWNHSSAIISCPETRSRLSPKQLDMHIVREAHRSELLRLENLPQCSEEIEWKRAEVEEDAIGIGDDLGDIVG